MGHLRYVTLTGAGENTDLDRLAQLSTTYPFVEWGVLYAPRAAGLEPRYPSLKWLNEFAAFGKAHRLNIALHLCGQAVKTLLSLVDLEGGAAPQEALDLLALCKRFGRVQLNTRAKPEDAERFFGLLGQCFEWGHRDNPQLILQWNAHNEAVCRRLGSCSGFNALVDDSGGRGIERGSWPNLTWNEATRPGFAGGLGPDNIETQLHAIDGLRQEQHSFWVDAEGKLRDEADRFDLDRAERMLQGARRFLQAKTLQMGAMFGSGTRRVRDLTGFWLDWWTAKALGQEVVLEVPACGAPMVLGRRLGQLDIVRFRSDEQTMTPYLANEQVWLMPLSGGSWTARAVKDKTRFYPEMRGSCLQVAGMRAIIAKHFGEEVPVNPGELESKR